MSVPGHPIGLMAKVYREVFPVVHEFLGKWREKAEQIPDPELRSQAVASIDSKSFHCEGGSILAILAGSRMRDTIEFIVAYQTISDYLDNLCDRSTSLDPEDFAMLHKSMPDALTCGAELRNYYQCRKEQNDGGYLNELVTVCQRKLGMLENYEIIKPHLLELAGYYCDLQVHKHVMFEERVPRLENWFDGHRPALPDMEWYEFSACAGSTLGIFCLVSYAFQASMTEHIAGQIRSSYFPYIQGLHILLDYLIDQEEDLIEGDLNFCSYYPSREEMISRMQHFIQQADKNLAGIPHENFHKLINRGLLGVYLSDSKIAGQRDLNKIARKLLLQGGSTSLFFYLNGRAYRTFQKFSSKKSS
ncbi:tetraprenyl-beta-curcumene synthase family protein [Metabacillus sp. GX 13764]|uniref:tetraprenyl-beta-curcumene synthase family protein n=1 Tax=Metabacillus kandeliae TaxID=2900151 RepID=UPI001E465637|nr:tetraprenyl-beta-curcumene synthase family protein [Metabacillus kandeliae]MCD7032661.1 tetraprenyl-beta-curcumene synthase family protein [Metabacillus kandeliae]